jgi:hypothetical protein
MCLSLIAVHDASFRMVLSRVALTSDQSEQAMKISCNPTVRDCGWISRARSRSASQSVRQTRGLALVVGAAFAVSAYTVGASAFDNSVPSGASRDGTVATSTAAGPAYPLKASANNRYLVDQDNMPFLIIGDSPQALIGNLSQAEAATFIANRQAYGINALWINLLCNDSTFCKSDGGGTETLTEGRLSILSWNASRLG